MRDLPWQAAFAAALCFSGSFGYFDDDGNAAFLRAVRRALKPGARFLIDTHIAETVLPILQERGWDRFGETVVLQERRYDHESGRIEGEWTFVREASAASSRTSIRLYTYRELAELLRGAGFAAVDGYGALDQPFRVPGHGRLLAVATA
jgi:SAM-dependent methyltransferase